MRTRQIIATSSLCMAATGSIIVVLTGEAVALDLTTAVDAARALTVQAWTISYQWATDNYYRTPAIMVGLAALLLLPPLALASGLITWLALPRPSMRATDRHSTDPTAARGKYSAATDDPTNMAWPREAWLTFDQRPDLRRSIPRELLSIGRGEDNDLVLDEATVHRYHAIIQRTPEALFLIKDLAGPGGNGVLVNDERVTEAHLLDADRITLGTVTIVFHARRIGGGSLSDGHNSPSQ